MKLLKWIALLLVTQCFSYQETNSGLVFNLGLTVTPDRLVFIIVFMLATWTLICGELQFPSLGKVGFYTLLFAVICTASSFLMGKGSQVLYYLFDFIYKPFLVL